MQNYIIITLLFLVMLGYILTLRNKLAKNVAENIYEERPFPVYKTLEMTGLFNTKFPDIKLYDLERDDELQIIESSPLYVEIAKYLTKEIKIDENDPNFDINEVFVKLGDKESDSYKTYVHIMRCLTNVNFDAFIMKGYKYDFSNFNKEVMREIEYHTDKIIVEVGTYVIEQILDMMS